jgi:hypothetical protein
MVGSAEKVCTGRVGRLEGAISAVRNCHRHMQIRVLFDCNRTKVLTEVV